MATTKPVRTGTVWVLPVATGGCGACVQQMYALLAPRYAAELRARGIGIALSPHHADVVLLAGPLTNLARAPIARLLESVPQPRALVAVGDCAINGCVFRGSPVLVESAAEELDVNVELPGCPPPPEAILDAITQAAAILAAEDAAEPLDGDNAAAEDEASDDFADDESDAGDLAADAGDDESQRGAQ